MHQENGIYYPTKFGSPTPFRVLKDHLRRICLLILVIIDHCFYRFVYISEFMKTVSSLKQNFFACLPAIAGREASPVLEKPGELPSRRVRGDSLVVWLPVDTKQGGAALPPGGCGGSQKRAFSSVKRLIFVAGELWPGIDLLVESPNTSRPDTRKVGE